MEEGGFLLKCMKICILHQDSARGDGQANMGYKKAERFLDPISKCLLSKRSPEKWKVCQGLIKEANVREECLA